MSGTGTPTNPPREIITAVQNAPVRYIISSDDFLAEGKHSHWLKCLDSDNFSIFIKTWFAFLASVHQLVITCATPEKKDELELAKGDKPFLDEFKSLYHRIKLNDLSTKNILDVFQTSRQVIFDYFPQYYYQTYFKKLVPNKICIKEPYSLPIRRGLNTSYKLDIELSEKHLTIGILFTDERIFDHIHEHYVYVKLEIGTLPDVHLLIENPNVFYDYIRSKLSDKLVNNIRDPLGSPYYNKTLEKISAVILKIDQFLKTADCHKTIFVPWITTDKPIEGDLKEWFFDFCYKLRNILFHRIIDPFDDNWSRIIKYSHQGLRELLLENIRLLKESEGTKGE